MGSFMANFKGQKAARLQSKGNYDEARKVYAEAYAAGMNDPRLLLAYSVLLIRAYEFEAAKELLVKHKRRRVSLRSRKASFSGTTRCAASSSETSSAALICWKSSISANPRG